MVALLQGFSGDREFNQAKKLLTAFTLVDLGGHDIAIRCLESGDTLLHSDSGFVPFAKHLGLKSEF